MASINSISLSRRELQQSTLGERSFATVVLRTIVFDAAM